MPTAYPYASNAKVAEALAVIEAGTVGYNETALKQVIVALSATGTLTPPTVAPVLTYDPPLLGSFIVNLYWTASNKTSSPGFGYRVYMQYNSGGFNDIETVNALTTYYDGDPNAGTYDFYITPFNDAGEGPSSNTVSVVLPGEFEASLYRRPDGISLYHRPDGTSLYLRP